jgi:hypothetical protein
MPDPPRLPPGPTTPPLRSLLRWGTAACVGVTVTFGIFTLVLGIRVEDVLVESLLRFFPLKQVPVSQEDLCAMGPRRLNEAVIIEGSVGRLVGKDFVALDDAEVLGERLAAADEWMKVEAGGRFRFVTALPRVEDADCDVTPEGMSAPTPQLVIRAPGCQERHVPVVRPWIPRRIVLACEARG